MVEGANYELETAYPCPQRISVGMYFTLESGSAALPLKGRVHDVAVPLHHICAPDLEGELIWEPLTAHCCRSSLEYIEHRTILLVPDTILMIAENEYQQTFTFIQVYGYYR